MTERDFSFLLFQIGRLSHSEHHARSLRQLRFDFIELSQRATPENSD